MKNQTAKSLIAMLALVLGIACAPSAPAQTFKHVKVKGGTPLEEIAAGGASVWALSNTGNPYVLKGKQFVLANIITLSHIAVGGGNLRQADEVWALDSAGKVYRASKSGASYAFSQVPGILNLIAVGSGYHDNCHPYEVWGLNASTQIFRYNYCTKIFDQAPGFLSSLAVGGGDMWGINANGAIFRFDFTTGGFEQLPGVLTQVAVGPNGFWGLYNTQIYEFYDDIQNFAQLPGILTEIHAGGNGVWGLNAAGSIFRLDSSPVTFVQIPGTLARLSVGSGAGVWGINGGKEAYGFSTP
jgi:hypothetical protein